MSSNLSELLQKLKLQIENIKTTTDGENSQESHHDFTIAIVGGFGFGKSTFINTFCEQWGMYVRPQTQPAMIGEIGYGQKEFDENVTLRLIELHDWRDIQELPGTLLGIILLFDPTSPRYYKETKPRLEFLLYYIDLPIVCGLNVRPHFNQNNDDKNKVAQDWDYETVRNDLQIPDQIPIINCQSNEQQHVENAIELVIETAHSLLILHDKQMFPLYKNRIISSKEQLSRQGSHKLLFIVGMSAWLSAHYFLDTLMDKSIWVRIVDHDLKRMGYIDIDDSLRLHIYPLEHFGTPSDPVTFAVSQVEALQKGKPMPIAFEEHKISLPEENTLGCIGILHKDEGLRHIKAQHLAKLVSPHPLLFLDHDNKRSSEADHAKLPSDIPVLGFSSDDKNFARKAICHLCNQLSTEEAKRIREKFEC